MGDAIGDWRCLKEHQPLAIRTRPVIMQGNSSDSKFQSGFRATKCPCRVCFLEFDIISIPVIKENWNNFGRTLWIGSSVIQSNFVWFRWILCKCTAQHTVAATVHFNGNSNSRMAIFDRSYETSHNDGSFCNTVWMAHNTKRHTAHSLLSITNELQHFSFRIHYQLTHIKCNKWPSETSSPCVAAQSSSCAMHATWIALNYHLFGSVQINKSIKIFFRPLSRLGVFRFVSMPCIYTAPHNFQLNWMHLHSAQQTAATKCACKRPPSNQYAINQTVGSLSPIDR